MLVTNHETNHSELIHVVPKCIKIRNNVALPSIALKKANRYGFISTLEVGESFEINGDTPDFKPRSLVSAAYSIARHVRRTTNKDFRVACRTIEGTSTNPVVTGCWRIS